MSAAPPPADSNSDRASRFGAPAAAAARRGGLGRGLGALIPTASVATETAAALDVPIDALAPNPYQPRTGVDPDQLQALAESIRIHGVIQPLIVTRAPEPGRYILIAGERRWRACRLAGLAAVPVVVKDAAPRAMLELALVENVVRADLAPLEEAAAYRQLIEEFGLTQASVADRVGRSRASVANTLRLLAAPEAIQAALNDGTITEGHARALLGLPTALDQVAALGQVIERGLTVRQTEELVRGWAAPREVPAPPAPPDPDTERLEGGFRRALGARVTLKRGGRGGRGSLTIHFHSDDELGGLYRRLVGEEDW